MIDFAWRSPICCGNWININYIMKKLFVVFVTLASCLMLNAQEDKVKSIVQLNGSKDYLYGYVSQYPDGSYLVETDAADIFCFSASEVKRVSAIPLKSKGYMGLVEAEVGFPSGSISVVNGYRFSPMFFLGLGVGYKAIGDVGKCIPIFLQARTELSRRIRKVAPYMAFNIGVAHINDYSYYDHYSQSRVEDSVSDPMVDFTFGLRSDCRKHGAMWYGICFGALLDPDAMYLTFKLAYSF